MGAAPYRDPAQVLLRFIAGRPSQAAAAIELGVSAAYLVDLKRGRRGFSDVMLEKLGLRRVVIDRKAS